MFVFRGFVGSMNLRVWFVWLFCFVCSCFVDYLMDFADWIACLYSVVLFGCICGYVVLRRFALCI